MNTLSTIKSLIGKLKREEVKSLLKFLRYYLDTEDESKGKGTQLVENILADPECTAKDLQAGLYGKENYHAFSKLLNRTKDKIYEVLLFDQNLSKPYYSNRNRIVFEIRKKLLQSEILLLRGMTDEFENFLNKIISKAKEYEVYDSLIEALLTKQRFMVLQSGSKEVEKIEKEIVIFEESRKKVQKARTAWTRIGSIINQSTSPIDYLEDLELEIKALEIDYRETNSASIGYFYYFLYVEWLQINKRYSESEQILIKLFDLVKSNVSIYTRARCGDVQINLSNNEILLGDFKLAISNAIVAQDFFDFESLNYYVAREIEFYAHFYSNEIDLAEKIISDICNSTRSANTPFLYSKWRYLFACTKTKKGEILISNELLQEYKEIESDKEGWNLSKRVLTIINRIDSNDLESADLKVLGLEKFVKRILKSRHVRKRDVIIIRVLMKLINEGFDFEKVYRQRKRYFDLLESNHPDYGWKIKSPELIIFHEWYRNKMAGKKPLA